ncbi:MAG: hypothetical protein QOH87_4174, partial [Trebonia sp.]|nr:hypothetical protein [Trebonia sp.]
PLATDMCAAEEPSLDLRGGKHAVACHYPVPESGIALPAQATAR